MNLYAIIRRNGWQSGAELEQAAAPSTPSEMFADRGAIPTLAGGRAPRRAHGNCRLWQSDRATWRFEWIASRDPDGRAAAGGFSSPSPR